MRFRLSQIKIRTIVIFVLFTFFIFLVYTHGPPPDSSETNGYNKRLVNNINDPMDKVDVVEHYGLDRQKRENSDDEFAPPPPIINDNYIYDDILNQNVKKDRSVDKNHNINGGLLDNGMSNRVNHRDPEDLDVNNRINNMEFGQNNADGLKGDNKVAYRENIEGFGGLDFNNQDSNDGVLNVDNKIPNRENIKDNDGANFNHQDDGKSYRGNVHGVGDFNDDNDPSRYNRNVVGPIEAKIMNSEELKKDAFKYEPDGPIFKEPENFFHENIQGFDKPFPRGGMQGNIRAGADNPMMNNHLDPNKQLHVNYINKNVRDLVYYKKDEPLIWVTGHPRSGTTLMRAMLDAHPSVRCGEETHIIPRILGLHGGMQKSSHQMSRLTEANINQDVIDNAVGAYVMMVIAQHGEPADRLCNKDPLTLTDSAMIRRIFPESKFIFMIRDGRAVVHSVITRKVSIQGFELGSYSGGLKSWNNMMTRLYKNCQDLGPDVCLPVYYEQLVLHPREQMERVLHFMELDWDDIVLRHEETIGKTGGVSLSKKEMSTDQVEKPVNLLGLTSWVDDFPEEAKNRIHESAPLLKILGYDPDGYPPNYGKPDQEVLENTKKVKKELAQHNLNIQERKENKQTYENDNRFQNINKEKLDYGQPNVVNHQKRHNDLLSNKY